MNIVIIMNLTNCFQLRPFLERYGLQGGTVSEGAPFNRLHTCRYLD